VQPRKLRGRLTLPKKASPAPTIAPSPASTEPHHFNPDDIDLQLLHCSISNAVSVWQNARARDGVDDTGDLIGKAEAGRRLHRALNRLARGGGQ